jgi:Icc-related predicted phosphoesterase
MDAGCEELSAALKRVQPLVHIYGHIHEGYGCYISPDGTACINASSVDFSYRGVNTPIVFDVWRTDE